MAAQDIPAGPIQTVRAARLRYAGSDTALSVAADDLAALRTLFEAAHRQRYGFVMLDKDLIVEAASVEVIGAGFSADATTAMLAPRVGPPRPATAVRLHIDGTDTTAPLYRRDTLRPGDRVPGPAIIGETGATTLIETGWCAEVTPHDHLVLTRHAPRSQRVAIGTDVDPILLEVFNNLFMAIAEQMGVTLANTAHSVNIKERLDFSCALFDRDGQLIANAPHIPVHLGSMGEAVRAVIQANQGRFQPGDVYATNAPYNGGTHLPDITVITPVFDEPGRELLFYVASRGHHADIGGITPGSMPPDSITIDQEGVLLDHFQLVAGGRFRERELLGAGTARHGGAVGRRHRGRLHAACAGQRRRIGAPRDHGTEGWRLHPADGQRRQICVSLTVDLGGAKPPSTSPAPARRRPTTSTPPRR
jgi:5-oxoprolinase (ATP-hydrolysing)